MYHAMSFNGFIHIGATGRIKATGSQREKTLQETMIGRNGPLIQSDDKKKAFSYHRYSITPFFGLCQTFMSLVY